jgi:hypothetical protein
MVNAFLLVLSSSSVMKNGIHITLLLAMIKKLKTE